jgi:transcriptional regulator with XRE-family HTH domain
LQNAAVVRRADLAAFLRARRAAVAPQDVGLEPGPRRRTPGLRREEVAMLAGVSVSWYTWLEQGRPINASTDVLDALARALRLDAVERAHLLELAGHPTRQPVDPGRASCPPGVVELLRSVEPAPAFALGPTWDFIAWNEPFATLFAPIGTLPPDECNLVWLLFANDDARALNGEWENEARRTLSQYRAEVSPMGDDPAVASLVARLQEASPEFREWWPQYDVAAFESHRRTFNHPEAGWLQFDSEQFVPVVAPDVRIIVHLPVEGDDSVDRLAACGHASHSEATGEG